MSRNYGGPKLPGSLLGQVAGGRIAKRKQVSRKDQRKADRTSRKQIRTARPQFDGRGQREESPEAIVPVKTEPPTSKKHATKPPPKPKRQPQREPTPEELQDEEPVLEDDDDSDASVSDADSTESASVSDAGSTESLNISRTAAKSGLKDDDDEIAALERKLGMKGKSSKKVADDELDWLVSGGLSSEDEEDGFGLAAKAKRKRPEDEDWLKSKRRKAQSKKDTKNVEVAPPPIESEHEENEEAEAEADDLSDAIENPFPEDELSEGDFEDFDDMDGDDSADETSQPVVKKQKENPYVAPVAASTTKYVPPSMRKAASSDDELLKQLRRQLQGQLNRLSEANILSILQAVQDIYLKNARQHVTSVLIDLFRDLICDPAILQDTFLILHAGFAAAVYRTIGIDFGAQLLESIVESFDKHHTEASDGKQTLNLLAFLCNLYTLQAISSDIIFDYIRLLLNNFSEANTDLLVRVIRISGQQLRQDDPSSLKDIVLLLQRSVAALGGEANVSVRTKYMIETIHDLKNNKMKTGKNSAALSAEHMQRMKRTLGAVKNAKTTEPLRITLADIRDSDKKGKWWLVGASYKDPAKMANTTSSTSHNVDSEARDGQTGPPKNTDLTDPNDPDLESLARSQGMNSPVRIAIFICIAGAEDPHHAFLRIQKLNLKNKQQIENIPRVLLHCVAAESSYNHYYSIIATKFCADRKMRKAWQFAMLDVLRRCGEDAAGGPDSDDEIGNKQDITVRQVYNIAHLYATLVAEDLLRITVLKPIHFGPAAMSPKTKIFAEVLLVTTFVSLRNKKSVGKKGLQKAVEETFAAAHTVEGMAKGLVWFLEDVVENSNIPANKHEKKAVGRGVEYAIEALRDERKAVAAMRKGGRDGDDSD